MRRDGQGVRARCAGCPWAVRERPCHIINCIITAAVVPHTCSLDTVRERRICPWQFQFYIDNFEPDALVDFWHWNKKVDIVGGIPINDHLRPEAGHRPGVKPTARGATIGNGSFVNFNADLTDGEFYVR